MLIGGDCYPLGIQRNLGQTLCYFKNVFQYYQGIFLSHLLARDPRATHPTPAIIVVSNANDSVMCNGVKQGMQSAF